jgi:hypothetical protein
MKNIAHSLIMIFLFGILCPSYQAYAEGNKFLQKNINDIAIKKSVKENLAENLVADKNFVNFYIYMSTSIAIIDINSNLGSNNATNDIKQFASNNDGSTYNTLNDDKKNQLADIVGFKNANEMDKSNQYITWSINRLKTNFPAINQLSEDELEEVFLAVGSNLNIEEKLEKNLEDSAKTKCYADAKAEQIDKLEGRSLLKSTLHAINIFCIGALIACVITAVILINAGSGGAALAPTIALLAALGLSAGVFSATVIAVGLAVSICIRETKYYLNQQQLSQEQIREINDFYLKETEVCRKRFGNSDVPAAVNG